MKSLTLVIQMPVTNREHFEIDFCGMFCFVLSPQKNVTQEIVPLSISKLIIISKLKIS